MQLKTPYIVASYASRGAAKAYVLSYNFIYENGDIVVSTNVTFAKETLSGQWKFIGDPDQNNNGNYGNYGCVEQIISGSSLIIANLTNGMHNIEVKGTDQAGNESTSLNYSWKVD